MLNKKIALAILLSCCVALAVSGTSSAAQAPAPQKVKATGILRTAAGTPVPAANVRITHLASGQAWATWSDENGRFEMPSVPAGRYRIEAEQLGFDKASLEAEWAGEKPVEVEVKMQTAGMKPATATPPAQPAATAAQPAAPAGNSAPAAVPAAQPGSAAPAGRGAPQPAQRPGGAGFQQIDPTQLMNAASGAGAGAATGMEAAAATAPGGTGGDFGPLGDASSSDAFLVNGTVGRGATAGGGFNIGALMGAFPGGFGGSSDGFGSGGLGGGGGFPGQGGGAGPGGAAIGEMVSIFIAGAAGGGGAQRGGGQAQGQRGGQQNPQGRQQAQGRQQGQGQGSPGGPPGGPGGPGQFIVGGPGGFGDGMGALMGAQRLMRAAANRTRFGFYNRYGNSVADARPYSLTAQNPAKIDHYRERFGANVGGPLHLGKLYDGRDKTFFFVNYDLARQRNPVDSFATVPTAAERTGDFTARGLQLFDPNSNLNGPRALLGSVLPATMIDPAAAGLLPFIPLPNLPGTAQNFHLQARVPSATDSINIRFNHTITPKASFNFNYGLRSTRSESIPNFPTLRGTSNTLGQNATLGLNYQITQRLINNMSVNWSRNRVDSLNLFAFVNDIAGNLGITGISSAPINFGVPQINFTNFTDLNDPVPSLRRNQTLRFTDFLSWSRGRHNWRFGGEVRRQQVNNRLDPTARGNFSFTGLMTADLDATGRPVPGTGYDFADFLMGLPQSTNVRFGSSATYFRNWAASLYAQDDWRVHPRFSVNWGLRYEVQTPPVELFNKIANLDIDAAITQVATVVPGQRAAFSGDIGRALIRGDFNNFQPRLGLAFRPKLKHAMTIRAGYGIFYNGSIYNQLSSQLANQPPFAQAQTRQTTATQLLTLSNGFPPVASGAVPNTVAVDPDYRVGYAQIWNLSLETSITRQFNIEATYTGTKGTRLDLLRSPNRSLPTCPLCTDNSRRIPNAPGFTYDTSGASSIYHAMQLRVTRRFTRGMTAFGTYSFGKSLDNASSIGGGAQVVVQDDANFAAERGRSAFDITHQFRGFFMYELPFGERKRWAKSGKAASLLSNFSINSNLTFMSGTPFTARLLGSAANNSGTGNNFSERPDQVGDPSLPDRDPLLFFNPAAFAPPTGLFGNASRNTIAGPGTAMVGFSIGRWVRLGRDGQRRLDLRLEVQNLFNTPNFTGLNTSFSFDAAGNNTNPNLGRVQGARAMRSLDLNLRFNF